MWLYFDKNGILLEKLEHGNPARSGSADFTIFAHFEGLEYVNNEVAVPNASITLYRPDCCGSSDAPILMNRVLRKFELQ